MTLTSASGTAVPLYTLAIGPVPGGGTTISIPIKIDTFGSEINGGYKELRGTILGSDAIANPSYMRSWIPAQLSIASTEPAAMQPGTVVFDGYVQRPPNLYGIGLAEFKAVGASAVVEDAHQNLMYRVDPDPQDWGEKDGDPYGYEDNSSNFTVSTQTGNLRFTREGGGADFTGTDRTGVCIWFPGFVYVDVLGQQRGPNMIKGHTKRTWSSGSTTLEIYRATGPVGAKTQIGADLSLNDSVKPRSYDFSLTTATRQDLLRIDCHNTNNVTITGRSQYVAISNVKIYDIAQTDDWVAGWKTVTVAGDRSIVYDLSKRLGFSASASTIAATTALVLPLIWLQQNPLSDLLDRLATFSGFWWGCYNRDVAGKFQLYFSPWGSGSSTNWYTTMSEIVGKPDPSDAQINQAKVFYNDSKGFYRQVVVNADGLNGRPTDPFAGTVRALTATPKTLTYSLSDKQSDSILATAIGDAIIKDQAVPQYQGGFSLLSARQGSAGGTEKPGALLRAGDTVTVTDWLGGITPRTFRVYGTSNSSTLTTVDAGQKASTLEQLLSQAEKLTEQHKKWVATSG